MIYDTQFDNNNNSYASIKLHRYTNMIDSEDMNNDTEEFDDIIPLKLCDED